MTLYHEYLKWAGGPEKAAKSIGYTSQYLYLVRCGSRPVSRKLAEAIEKHSEGKFNKVNLLWPDETKCTV